MGLPVHLALSPAFYNIHTGAAGEWLCRARRIKHLRPHTMPVSRATQLVPHLPDAQVQGGEGSTVGQGSGECWWRAKACGRLMEVHASHVTYPSPRITRPHTPHHASNVTYPSPRIKRPHTLTRCITRHIPLTTHHTSTYPSPGAAHVTYPSPRITRHIPLTTRVPCLPAPLAVRDHLPQGLPGERRAV